MFLPVSETPDEWLRTVLGPVLLVVELPRVPVNFVEKLTHADRMGVRARATRLEASALGIGHVGHVVRRVEVFAIPATARA